MKDIIGFEGRYTIDLNGNVYSLLSNKFIQVNKSNYATVNLTDAKGSRRQYSVHRLIYQTYVGEIPSGYQIDHLDGNKLNNDISNLEPVTPKENSRRAVLKGLRNYSDISGSRNKNTKLSDNDCLVGLKRLIKEEDLYLYDLDDEYGMIRGYFRNIVNDPNVRKHIRKEIDDIVNKIPRTNFSSNPSNYLEKRISKRKYSVDFIKEMIDSLLTDNAGLSLNKVCDKYNVPQGFLYGIKYGESYVDLQPYLLNTLQKINGSK